MNTSLKTLNKSSIMLWSLLLSLIFIQSACMNDYKIIDDMNDASFELVNQDSVNVNFPIDFRGQYVVMGFVYTNCPDICPLITQNLIKIQKDLGYPANVQFLGVSFDPKRDTPEVLHRYKEVFKVDDNVNFLTGEPTIIQTFMDSVRVRTQESMRTTTESGKEIYFLNHSDKIMVMNPKGEIIIEYGGSMPSIPSLIVQDLQSLIQ
jgi:protein SCO1/2